MSDISPKSQHQKRLPEQANFNFNRVIPKAFRLSRKINRATLKVNPVISKVNQAISKVNQAIAQSRPSGILCAPAHGKLYFALLTSFRASQNNLPHKGEVRYSEVMRPC